MTRRRKPAKKAKKDLVELAADAILRGLEPAAIAAGLRKHQKHLSPQRATQILDAAKQLLQDRARAYRELHDEISIARLTDLYRRSRNRDMRVALRCAEMLGKLRPPQPPQQGTPESEIDEVPGPISFEERYRQSMSKRA
jgi:hypothetical protein